MTRPPRQQPGFTLIEMMISMAILVFILLIVTSFMNTVAATWTAGDQRVSTFQDGRAILDVIGRELSSAAMSPSLQLVATSRLTNTRSNSDSIFWQAPLTYRVSGSATPLTSVCEVGYFIDSTYNLRRFFVQPSDSANFQIYSTEPSDTDAAAWVQASYLTSASISPVIASGVVAFWIRCLDANGDAIPWLSTSYHYNSAAKFRPATLGVSNSFTYTGSATAQASLLPNAVELTLVLIDDKTVKKSLLIPTMIPAMPTVSSPAGVPTAITNFNASLITNKVSTARTFTSRVVIPSSSRQ
jgi:prepilin-type N-terminal cleavage/methylation domain-containing protein